MSRVWWQLPGPGRFVVRIVQDLRDGKNIVLCLPEHTPDGLYSSIRSYLGDEWPWYTLQVHDDPKAMDPIHALFARFVPQARADALWNAGGLVTEETFAGRLVWLDGLTPHTWPVWKTFFTEYEHACRSRSVLERTLFCIPLVGALAHDPPAEDICLAHHRWQGYVDLLDMCVFTALLLEGKSMPELLRRVVIALIAHVALWDPLVSESLAHEDLKTIFAPTPVLQKIAIQRGWDGVDEEVFSLSGWHRGMQDMVNGTEKAHSALLAARYDARALQQRLWSAEVGVILPFVEEQRQELLTRFAEALHVPFTTPFGEINDIHDLEIGHVVAQLAKHPAVSREMRQHMTQLHKIRNALSHSESLDLDCLLSLAGRALPGNPPLLRYL